MTYETTTLLYLILAGLLVFGFGGIAYFERQNRRIDREIRKWI